MNASTRPTGCAHGKTRTRPTSIPLRRPRSAPGGAKKALASLGAITALATLSTLTASLLVVIGGPVVGAAGVGAKGAADTFSALPTELATPPVSERTRILAEDGSLLATLYRQNREVVALEEISPHVTDALVAIEDARFYEHRGVDYKGVARAMVVNQMSGEVQQGASTLTQQYVKNVLMSSAKTPEELNAAKEKSVQRKLREMRYALELEKSTTKDEILEGYLNIAYYGDGAHGIQAAAQHYFGVNADDLTLAQAATLAGLVQSPSRYDPTDNEPAALGRRNVVLDAMERTEKITPAEADVARAEPLGLNVQGVPNGCEGAVEPFYCDWILRELLEVEGLGETREARMETLLTGGLTVKTTMDPKVQIAARESAAKHVPPTDSVAAAVAVVQPGTGKVKALAVNRTYGEAAGQTKLNLATGGSSGFQTGSTTKPFVLAAALELGLPPDLSLHSPAVYTSPVFKNNLQPYVVRNYKGGGVYDMASATAKSVNTYYIQLQERTGIDLPVTIAEKLGVKDVKGRPLQRVPSFVLGVNETSPLAMAGAYAAFAADGKYCEPYGLTEIVDRDQQPIPVPTSECTQVLKPSTTNTMSAIMRGGVENGTGRNARIDRPAAGKTGTTNSNSAVWFAGYTKELAGVVWVGDPRGGYQHPLTNRTVNGKHYENIFGGTLPAPIWRDTMLPSLAGVESAPMPGVLLGTERSTS